MTRTKHKILLTIPIEHLPGVKQMLERNAEVTYLDFPSKEELLNLVGQYDALIPNLAMKLDSEILDAATSLRLIATPSTGTDHIDLEYAAERGIEVQSLKHDYGALKQITSTAEHAFLLLLSIVRKLPFAFDAVRQGSWDNIPFRGRELQGRVYGILGYGRLGEIVSRYAHAFDMPVIAHDPNRKITDPWVEPVSFEGLLGRAEIISIHIHLTPETTKLLSKDQFDLMRDGVYIVNTSRGAIIDEAVLLAALKSGKVAGAAVDVIADELDGNISNHPLVQYAKNSSNLIITPHIGGVTIDSQRKAFTHTVNKLFSFFGNPAGK